MFLSGSPTKRKPGETYTVRYMQASSCRRPHCIQLGSPAMREAHYQDLHRHEGRSRPEALWCVHGKPDRAGGPAIKYTVRYTEAGLCRRPYCIQLGSPTMREAH